MMSSQSSIPSKASSRLSLALSLSGTSSTTSLPPCISTSERVKVIVRSRPLSKKEVAEGHERIVHIFPERREVEVKRVKPSPSATSTPGSEVSSLSFTFDAAYDERTCQGDLYNSAFHPLVSSIFEGFNGTIFAYGQTGTGKTYTMEGNREHPSEKGVIPNALLHIFRHVTENPEKKYLIGASYIEIYQEDIRDLLSKNGKQQKELRESPTLGVYVKDLSTHLCSSYNDVNELMTKGNKNRSIGATNMNEHSSRSHAIFTITIEISETRTDGKVYCKQGRLNLVDLAGSERQGKTRSSGERFKEATKINLSLSVLGNVIAALVDPKTTHIPYRDSKLTRLLQDSLGGNSKTIMVATIGPAGYNYEETITTLRYASRAKKIKNTPKMNEDPKDTLLREYEAEIERLRSQLQARLMQQMTAAIPAKPPEREKRRKKLGSAKPSTVSVKDDGQREEQERKLRELTLLLQPLGLDPYADPSVIMEKLAERKKALIKDKLTVQTEKEQLLRQLNEVEGLYRKNEEECGQLSERIQWLESKVLTGGKDLVDHTNEQQKLLEDRMNEIALQKQRYEELRKKFEAGEGSIEELRENAAEFESRLRLKIQKYRRIVLRTRKIKKIVKMKHAKQLDEMRRLGLAVVELRKEIALKTLIKINFVPFFTRRIIGKRIRWNEFIRFFTMASVHNASRIPRPRLNFPMRWPRFVISDRNRMHRIRRAHYRDENVLQLQPSRPASRTTRIYPHIQEFLVAAMRSAVEEMKEELVVYCNVMPRRRRRQSTIVSGKI